ncbi:hypothetical protein DYB32_007316, partial [Aphanomyces invadans]
VRAEVQQQGLQELTQAVQEKCFNKCITRPQERLDSKQQQCLSLCIERYIDTMKVVSASMMQRGQRVRSFHHVSHPGVGRYRDVSSFRARKRHDRKATRARRRLRLLAWA